MALNLLDRRASIRPQYTSRQGGFKVNRMDEIKNLASQTKSNLYHSQRGGMYVTDVNYLLSIIGDMTWALNEIETNEFLQVGATRLIAKHCLQSIREVK